MGGTPLFFDGKPVSTGIYNALVYWAPRFYDRWGVHLGVTDGLRSLENQWKAWNARKAFEAGTGPFAPVAAYPDARAPHIAGYGVDLYDTGEDAGVTVIGSPRNEWLHRQGLQMPQGSQLRLINVGRNFGEGWHSEIPQGTEWVGTPASSGGAVAFPDAALMRRKTEEETMYVAGKTHSGIAYALYTDAAGKPHLRPCGAGEQAAAFAGGLVISVTDDTLVMIATEGQYYDGPDRSAANAVWNQAIYRDVDGDGIADAVSALQELADIRSAQITDRPTTPPPVEPPKAPAR